jgi:hypothetical protein
MLGGEAKFFLQRRLSVRGDRYSGSLYRRNRQTSRQVGGKHADRTGRQAGMQTEQGDRQAGQKGGNFR